MSDGKGLGSSVGEAAKGIAKASTIDLAKDILEQIMGGDDSGDDAQESSSTVPNPQQKMFQQAQKNAKMAQISRNIQRIKKERELARKTTKQNEEDRLRKMEEHKQAVEQERQENSLSGKTAGIFKNFSNFLARKGKGEQRGNKIVG